jgi:hypothetical protein
MIFIIAGIIIFVIWAYVLFLRPQLVKWYPEFFASINQIEYRLWNNSRTIISARLYWVGGVLVAVHDFIAQQSADMTPFLSEAGNLIPEKYRPLALSGFLIVTGALFEWLRRVTTQPLEDKKVL